MKRRSALSLQSAQRTFLHWTELNQNETMNNLSANALGSQDSDATHAHDTASGFSQKHRPIEHATSSQIFCP